MCGIIGYVGASDALPIVADGLKNLEYRGYDSAGFALRNDGIEIYKAAGEIDDLERPESSDATCGIGHTRWSTHGEPTDENAHPHTDCTGSVAVVHNGIIENYDDLKADLADHEFTSETDTEVIPHLIEAEREAGATLREAVEAIVDRLEGSFAFCVVADDHDGIVAARRDSPLVIGYGESGTFVASDVPAFLEHTNRVSYVEDDDIVEVTADGAETYNEGDAVKREIRTVEWESEEAEKGGYEHYMLKEIHEQPRALRKTLSGRIDGIEGEVDLDLGFSAEFLESLEEVQIVGCGTSYHAGMYAGQLIERFADVRTSVEIASEYGFDGGRDPWRTLVVAVTQSGETADTIGAVRRANKAGAHTLAVTNVTGSSITRETDETMYVRAGPEISVAATKTFASQVTTLTLLAADIGLRRNTLDSEAADELLSHLHDLPSAVQQVLDDTGPIEAVAEEYVEGDAFFFLGRQLGYPVALEGALKLKETSYEHAEGFPSGELKHGPLALVTPETPVLAVLTEGTNPEQTLNSVKEVESRGAPVIGCTSLPEAEKYLDASLDVPELGLLEPLVANVYFQLFAYHVARLQGRPIDKPRNLAKSVTVA